VTTAGHEEVEYEAKTTRLVGTARGLLYILGVRECSDKLVRQLVLDNRQVRQCPRRTHRVPPLPQGGPQRPVHD
jgi:hypothetical protein